MLKLDTLSEKLSDARQETDGSITADCFVCEAEGHPKKRIKLYAGTDGRITGISCARFASAGKDANREHCAPIREALGLGAESSAFITSTLFDGERQVTIEIERLSKAVQFATARNCTSVLHSAELRLTKPDERAAFVKAIPDRMDAERAAIGCELVQLLDRFRRAELAVDKPVPDDVKESAATRLVKLADEAQLIHNADGEGFAVMMIDGHKETWPLRSKGFKRWIQRRFFEQYKKAPGSQAVQDALGVIEAKALYEGPERRIFVRIGEKDGKIYLDLADEKWRVVEIDADGWRVVDLPPVEFRCAKGMLPLPIPERGGNLDDLRPFLGLEQGDLWTLMLGSLVMKLRPRGPYCVDVFFGSQGCGKTTRARVIRALVDPSSADTRSAPRDVRDLQIAASNEWLPIFDNLSRIPEWLSDGFCCLSTGGGMRTRELYSDGDEIIFSTMRPMILTSITEVVQRPDLLDRSLIYNLPDIERKKRKPEKQLWQEFDAARPGILGALLDAVSCAIRNEDSVMIDEPSRLADFERWATAAEPAMGLKPGTFVRAYRRNQKSANDLALEACPVTYPVINLAQKRGEWLGTAKQLFDLLLADESELDKRKLMEDGWPKAPNGLSAMLRRLAPNLRMHGVSVEFNIRTDKKGSRKIRIALTGDGSQPEPEKDDDTQQDYECKTSSESVRPSDSKENKRLVGVPSDDLCPVSDDVSDDLLRLEDFAQTVSLPGFAECADDLTMTDDVLHTQSCDVQIVALKTEGERPDQKRGITSRNARMMGMRLSYDGNRVDFITEREAWPLMMPEPEHTVVFHDAKFGLGALCRASLPAPEKWEDTIIAAHLVNENGAHELKPLARELLDIEETMSFEEANKARLLDPEIFNEYAKNDVRITYQLWPKLKQEMEQQELMPVYDLEKRVVPVVMAMEGAGMKLDIPMLATLAELVAAEIERIQAEVYGYAGCQFELNSPAKVGAILFDKLGVPNGKTTGKGQRSVDKETLEDVRGLHPAVDALLRYRELDKLANSFIKTLPVYADEAGRVHPEFKQLGAKTGRFSCADPNVQQIPARSELGKKLRAAFIAEDGHKLVVADWSQMELRVLAQYSKDSLLLEAYTAERETDLHTLTAARMFGKAEADVTKPERSIAKMINFGIAYGITPRGLFNRLKPQGVDVTEAQCEQFVADYFKTYPGVRKFLNQVESRVRERGYVCNWFGRRRHVSGQTRREVRQAQNFIIQATSADLAKIAMVRLYAALPEGARLIAMVHDEFIVECCTEQAEVVRDLMTEVMGQVPEGFTIPMRVDAHIGNNWGECK